MARRTKEFHGCCIQHAGTETTTESSTEEVCRRELDNYLEYVWRPVGHERRVSAEEWWRKREYLWPRVATICKASFSHPSRKRMLREEFFRRQV